MYSHVRRRTRQFRIQRVTLLYRVAHQFRWVVSLDDWYKIQIIRTVVFCRYYWIQSTQQRQCNNGFVQDAAVAVTFSASDEFSEWPPAVRRIHVDCIVFVASSSESASLRYVVFFPGHLSITIRLERADVLTRTGVGRGVDAMGEIRTRKDCTGGNRDSAVTEENDILFSEHQFPGVTYYNIVPVRSPNTRQKRTIIDLRRASVLHFRSKDETFDWHTRFCS